MSILNEAQRAFEALKKSNGENKFGSPAILEHNRAVTMCSSFFRICAQRALGEENFIKLFGVKEPRASTINNVIKGKYEIKAVHGLKRGDIFSVGYAELNANGFSGHTAFIESFQHLNSGETIISVVDSTNSPHGANDERSVTGHAIGRGKIKLIHDTEKILGYTWSVDAFSDVVYNTDAHRVRIGRFLT